jgi:hypothetical protein
LSCATYVTRESAENVKGLRFACLTPQATLKLFFSLQRGADCGYYYYWVCILFFLASSAPAKRHARARCSQ